MRINQQPEIVTNESSILIPIVFSLSKSDIKRLAKIQNKEQKCKEKEDRLITIRGILAELNLPETNSNIDLINKHANKHICIQDFLDEIKNNQSKQDQTLNQDLNQDNCLIFNDLPVLFNFLHDIPEII